MTPTLPPLPDRAQIADLCRETAARESVQPDLVEKDFYLTRLLWALGQVCSATGSSSDFVALVNAKLNELGAAPLESQTHPFGLDARRRRALEKGLKTDLPAVLRTNAPPFDLDRMLRRFDRLWGGLQT